MTHCHHHLAPPSPSTQGSRQAQLPSPPHRDESPSLLLRCPQRRQTWGPAALQGAGSRGGGAGSGCGWAASSWLREFRGTRGHFPSRSHGFSALARGHGRHPRQVSSSAQAGRSPRLSLEITLMLRPQPYQRLARPGPHLHRVHDSLGLLSCGAVAGGGGRGQLRHRTHRTLWEGITRFSSP